MQGWAGDVPDGGAAAGGLLQEGGDLVEGQVAGAAEFQDLAAQAGYGRGVADQGRYAGLSALP